MQLFIITQPRISNRYTLYVPKVIENVLNSIAEQSDRLDFRNAVIVEYNYAGNVIDLIYSSMIYSDMGQGFDYYLDAFYAINNRTVDNNIHLFYMDIDMPMIYLAYLDEIVNTFRNVRFSGFLHACARNYLDIYYDNRLHRDLENIVMRYVYRIFVASKYASECVRTWFNREAEIAGMAINPEIPRISVEWKNREIDVLYCSRPTVQKGYRIVEKLKKKLYIETVYCSTLSELYSKMLNSKIVIFPSLDEMFGLACIEAVLCGCVVVTSDVGAFREYVPHQLRVRLDEKAVRNFYRKIVRILSDESYAYNMLRLLRYVKYYADRCDMLFREKIASLLTI